MAKNSSPSRAPKKGAQLWTTCRSAKNAAFHGEKPINRQAAINTAILLVGMTSRFPVRTCAWIPTFTWKR